MRTWAIVFLITSLWSTSIAKQATIKFDFGPSNANKEMLFALPVSDGRYFHLNHVRQRLDTKGKAILRLELSAPGIIYVSNHRLYEIYIEPQSELSVRFDPVIEFGGSLAEENKLLNGLERQGVALAIKASEWPVAMKKLARLTSPDSLLVISDAWASAELDLVRSQQYLSKDFIDFVENDTKLFYLDVAFSSIANRLTPYLNATVKYDSSQVHSAWGVALTNVADRVLPIVASPSSQRSRHAFSCLYDLILRYKVAFLKENNAIADERSMESFQYDLFWAAPQATDTYLDNDLEEYFIPSYLSFYITGTIALYSPQMIAIYDDFSKSYPSSPYLGPLKSKIDQVKKVVNVNDVKSAPGVHVIKGFEKISDYENMIAPFKGKVVYIDIWAMWCSPCIAEFEFYEPLMKLAKKEKDFEILFLSRDKISALAKWESFINKRKLEGYHMIPGEALEADLRNRIGWNAIPRYVIVNKAGEIVETDATPPRDTQTIARIRKLLD